ncbi:superfamily I DNA and/or RNA helicase [Winogradskyella eximia]|uniref:Superfamily I DNA and/or RNA helicase n=1 Tax=Winogradskyella eximia TaxID=262006 RepID=A0A3D9H185_9FLAO|nr:AAA domain-containing protein [Winogradskyella eximia]RED42921.1 superfamily I DNA and/or RNA helicase [Winogradskyella eximia]
MTVIQKYIEFLREYNKLLEKGSKNVLRLKNTLWKEDIDGSSIVVKNNFENLFTVGEEGVNTTTLLDVKRPLAKKDTQDEDEETFQEKFDREAYSYFYQAARDTAKNSSLEFVYSFGLFHLKLGDSMVKVHLFHIPLTAVIKGSKVVFKLHISEDPYIDAFFLNNPQIDRSKLLEIISAFEKGIDEQGIAYLKSPALKKMMSNDVLALHPSLVYDPSTSKPIDTLTTNFVKFAPCFILRQKRSRHFQKLMDKIIDFTKENNVNPSVLDILLGQKNNLAQGQSHYFANIYESIKDKFASLEATDFEAFFPLLYNREQLEIYKNYKTHELSVVTGPPGTGKSHSIVNLLCAMLAEGKRILITAKTDKALESLLDKIPPQFDGLVMADIKQQNQSDYTLSNSIDNIRQLLLNNNGYDLNLDLERLNKSKENYITEKKILSQLLNQEYTDINIPYFERDFSIYELYTFVYEQKVNWDYIKDTVNDDTLAHSEEINKALKKYISLQTVDKQFSTINFKETFNLLDLVDFDTYDSLTDSFKNKLEILKVSSFREFNIDRINGVLKSLKSYKNEDLISENKDLLESLLRKRSIVEKVVEDYQINRSAQEIKQDSAKYARDISTYLALLPEGKDKLSFFQKNFNSLYKTVKYIDLISVNDVFCNNRKTLMEFRAFLNSFSKLNELIEVLIKNNFIDYALKEQCSLKEMQAAAKKGVNKADVNLTVLNKLNEESVRYFKDKYDITGATCEKITSTAQELIDVYEEARTIKDLKENVGVAIKNTKKVISTIGISSFNKKEDVATIKSKLKELESAHIAHQESLSSEKILKDFIPDTLKSLKSDATEVLGVITKDSFYLKYGAQLVEAATSIDLQQTSERLRHATEAIKNCKADILSGLAKENFKKRFDQQEKNDFINLLSNFEYEFKQSKRGIADKDKFRRNAQQTAKSIAPNISCWVMKFDDVLKTVDTTPEVFDCIITDEASQLNFNSLLLGYYGKKMIVVGDEKQTSPEDVAITNEAFDSLRKDNLDFMGSKAINIRADASLFSLANLVSGSTSQMLREHFRCVPELIDFSKKHFYENKLVPLKVISANRLIPKIRVFVKNTNYRDKVVKEEIVAISKKLQEMIEDPLYSNKTIGVVSLGLAKHTRELKMIIEDFPIKKLEKHNIIIDSPSQFQGDERDVILVSLGVASTVNEDHSLSAPGSIVDNIDQNLTSKLRGINVGLSRAKEQMILFHSIELDKLKTTDFRRKIISFFDEKFSPVLPIELPPNLEKKHRIPENRPKPFDSWFEYDVASLLFKSGYHHIVPQYEIKKKELFHNPRLGRETYVHFKLDLVVYNNGTPLAIECDGDAYHSSIDDVAYDIERQEFLERIGWKIHRVTYSSFRIDPEGELEKLINFIERNSQRQIEVLPEMEEEGIEDVESVEETTSDDFLEVKEISSKDDEALLKENETPDLFSLDYSITAGHTKPTVKVNSKCKITMLDIENQMMEVLLMDIPRNQQPKSRDGIQILSIYSDLGKLLMGNKEGEILMFPEKNQRVRIDKVY